MADLNPEDFGAVPVAKSASPKPEDFGATPVSQATSMGQKFGMAGISSPVTSARMPPPIARVLRKTDPGIDYSTDIQSAGFKYKYALLDTDEERRSFLDSQVGKDNVGRDSYGQFFVKPDGLKKLGIQSDKPVAVASKTSSNVIGTLARETAPMVGMVGGGIVGAGLGAAAGGPPGMAGGELLGSGAGAAAGEAVNKLQKQFLGLNQQSAGQTAADIGKTGSGAAIAQGALSVLRPVGRALFGPYHEFLPQSEASYAQTREAVGMGLRPNVSAYQPSASLLQRDQAVRNMVWGDRNAITNTKVLEREGRTILNKAGGEVSDLTVVNKGLADKAKSVQESFGAAADAAAKDAQRLLDANLAGINRSLGHGDPNVVGTVAQDISKARSDFGTAATKLYSDFDKMAGVPVIPTQALRNEAQKIAAKYTGDIPKSLKEVLDLPEFITGEQMQFKRTLFREAGGANSLVPDIHARDAGILADAADRTFTDASTNATKRFGQTGSADTTKAIEALRSADAFYAQGIQKFDKPIFQSLLKQAKISGDVDPVAAAKLVTNSGFGALKDMVKPETWKAIGREKFNQMVTGASDPLTGELNGKALSNELKKMGGAADVLYGADANAMRTIARQQAALGLKIPLSELNPAELPAVLKNAIARKTQLDQFMSTNAVAELAKGGANATNAADWVFVPGETGLKRVTDVIKAYGPDSKEVTQLRQYGIGKLLDGMRKTSTENPNSTVVDGQKLVDELNTYGRPVVDRLLGKELSSDMYRLARVAQFSTMPNRSLAGGSMAAGAYTLHPIEKFWGLVDLGITGQLLAKPGVIKWLSEGFEARTAKGASDAFAKVLAAKENADRTADAGKSEGYAYKAKGVMQGATQ